MLHRVCFRREEVAVVRIPVDPLSQTQELRELLASEFTVSAAGEGDPD